MAISPRTVYFRWRSASIFAIKPNKFRSHYLDRCHRNPNPNPVDLIDPVVVVYNNNSFIHHYNTYDEIMVPEEN